MGRKGVVCWCLCFFVTVWCVRAARLGSNGLEIGDKDNNTTVAAYGGFGEWRF
ncbi:hypothetical protein HanPI659440_Chr11g0406901 [Helianthus annuus]|nr:hypothetical protein HanPI659440_Chr11g0406901 [Helianthus annuus]